MAQRLVIIPDNFFEVINNFRNKYRYTWKDLTNIIGVSYYYFFTIRSNLTKAIFEEFFDRINEVLIQHGETPFEKHCKKGTNSPSVAVSQRTGDAHLCINGMLLCGETDLSVRYYRAHEEWLNQAEICPDCLKAFKEAEKIWKNNQEPSKIQPEEQVKEPKREEGVACDNQSSKPSKVILITPYGNLEIPQGTKVRIEHQVGGDIHIDIWPEEDNR